MKRRLAAAGATVVAALASTAAAAPVDGVTLTMQRFLDRFTFSGRISSGAPNEYVAVIWQKCGYTYGTSLVGTQTKEGGSWEIVVPSVSSGTYRARWRDHLSGSVRFRAPIPVWFAGARTTTPLAQSSRRGPRLRVIVSTTDALQNMSGRIVELQRLAAGRWTRVRRARLAPEPEVFGRGFSATFTVRTRGLTLRVVVPARSAAPCYTAATTETWTS